MGRTKPWKLFYSIGAIFGAVGLLISVVLLLLNLVVNVWIVGFAPGSHSDIPREPFDHRPLSGQRYTVTAFVPGVNLPLAHVAYILPAILVCLIVHEAGHAICAGRGEEEKKREREAKEEKEEEDDNYS